MVLWVRTLTTWRCPKNRLLFTRFARLKSCVSTCVLITLIAVIRCLWLNLSVKDNQYKYVTNSWIVNRLCPPFCVAASHQSFGAALHLQVSDRADGEATPGSRWVVTYMYMYMYVETCCCARGWRKQLCWKYCTHVTHTIKVVTWRERTRDELFSNNCRTTDEIRTPVWSTAVRGVYARFVFLGMFYIDPIKASTTNL